MKNRSPSFPKKVAEKNRERWVVYYFDTDKQKRWARRFSTEAEALEFFREKNVYDEKLGVEADRISPNDRRELVEAKMLLSPLWVSLTNAVLTYVKLTNDLQSLGISLSQAIEEYKSLAKLKERSARLDFAIDKYCYSLLKKELSSEYVTGVERTLARFMGDFGKERIVSLITGREIFQWLINLKKREYDESDKLHVDGRPMRVFKETSQDLGTYSRNEYRRTLYSFFKFCKCRTGSTTIPWRKSRLGESGARRQKFLRPKRCAKF